MDGSYVKSHQHSAGGSFEENQAIGLSRGGNTNKIHLAVDSYGLPIELMVTGGEVHDSKMANALIEILPSGHLLLLTKVMTVKRFEIELANAVRSPSLLESKIRQKGAPI